MSERESALKALAEAIRPVYGAMFRRAHAITGNDLEAEEALRRAILACADDLNAGDTNAASTLRALTTEYALARAGEGRVKDEWDVTFECFTMGEGEADGVFDALSTKDDAVKRLALLRYACGLSPRQIAAATGMDIRRVKSALDTLIREIARSEGVSADVARARVKTACERELSRERFAPDINSMLRAVELELSQPISARSNTRFGRAFSWLIALISLILLAALMWLGMLLINYFRELRIEKQLPPVINAIEYMEEIEYDARV